MPVHRNMRLRGGHYRVIECQECAACHLAPRRLSAGWLFHKFGRLLKCQKMPPKHVSDHPAQLKPACRQQEHPPIANMPTGVGLTGAILHLTETPWRAPMQSALWLWGAKCLSGCLWQASGSLCRHFCHLDLQTRANCRSVQSRLGRPHEFG